MPARHFHNWLTGYAHYTRHSESPDLFHFWTGVYTIAGVLRRQVWIDQLYFQWTPNFYIVLVGPPGVAAKSTALRLGTALLSQIDGVHFGPRSMTWQGLTGALEEASELVQFPDNIFLPMSCITCSINELGTFLRPEDKEMVDVLVDLWDGQLETWSRRTQALEGRKSIDNPWIHVMGCTTPAWLQANFTEAMIGGGLTSRIVWVFGNTKRQLIAYPADEIDIKEFDSEERFLVSDLERISHIKGEYHLTTAAKTWGKEWYEKHWSSKPEHMVSDRYGGYIARKQSHIHKLAIVLAAAQRDELTITKNDLFIANQMTTGLEVSMQKVFQSIGVGDSSRLVNEILAYVRAYKEISQQKLWRHMMPIMSAKEFEDAGAAAVKAGYMRIRQIGCELFYCAVKQKEINK